MNYYPAFLDLTGRRAVVVGGGEVAERKILSLLKAGAEVTVISPSLTKRLSEEKARRTIRHLSRKYRGNDLEGAFIVIAATDSPDTNRRVAAEAPALVNVVDVPSECNFIAPAVVGRGPLTIAISTGGASPATAKAIRKEIEKLYGPAFAEYLSYAGKMRAEAIARIRNRKTREKFLKGLASEEMLDMLRSRGMTSVREEVAGRLKKIAATARTP